MHHCIARFRFLQLSIDLTGGFLPLPEESFCLVRHQVANSQNNVSVNDSPSRRQTKILCKRIQTGSLFTVLIFEQSPLSVLGTVFAHWDERTSLHSDLKHFYLTIYFFTRTSTFCDGVFPRIQLQMELLHKGELSEHCTGISKVMCRRVRLQLASDFCC